MNHSKKLSVVIFFILILVTLSMSVLAPDEVLPGDDGKEEPKETKFTPVAIDAYTTEIAEHTYNVVGIQQNVLNEKGNWESCDTALNYTQQDGYITFKMGNKSINISYDYDIQTESLVKTTAGKINFEVKRENCNYYYTQNITDSKLEVDSLTYTLPKDAKFSNDKIIYQDIIVDFNQARNEQGVSIVYNDITKEIQFTGENITKLDPTVFLNGSNGYITDDSYTNQNSANANYGASTEYFLRAASGKEYAAYIKLKLVDLQNSNITEAMLYVYPDFLQTAFIYEVYPYPYYNISGLEWIEGNDVGSAGSGAEITYNNRPSTSTQMNMTYFDNLTNVGAGKYYPLNVTSQVFNSIINKYANITFKLNSTQTTSSTLYPKEGTSTKRHYFNITYIKYLSLDSSTVSDISYVNSSYTVNINISTTSPYNDTIFYNINGGTNITLCKNCTNYTSTISTTNFTDGTKTLTIFVNDSTGVSTLSEVRTFYYYNGSIITASQTVCGEYNYTNLWITNNSVLTVCAYNNTLYQGNNWTGMLRINTQSILVDNGVVINGSTKGYRRIEGPGKGNSASGWGSGAGYGGAGGAGYGPLAGGVAYGNSTDVTDRGSGAYQGLGGAYIKINATNTANISGIIEVNGQENTGGGAGGGIYILSNIFDGVGTIQAKGGKGTASYNGGGGGGRIYITYCYNYSTTNYSVIYGAGSISPNYDGNNGTLYLTTAGSTCSIPSTPVMTWINGTNRTLTEVYWNFTATANTLAYWLYGNNMSGSWTNSSYTAIAGTSSYDVFSFNLSNATRGKYVCFQVFVNDTIGRQNYSNVNCIDTANTAPVVPYNLPPDGAASGLNNITFNWTSYDADGDSMEYFLYINTSNEPSTLYYNGTAANFSTNFSDGTYYWTVFAGDRYNNGTNTSIRSFVITTSAPAVSLETEDLKYYNTNLVVLNYSVFDGVAVDNCSLWINSTGTWSLNKTNDSTILMSTTAYFNVTQGDGDYKWNVQCYDDLGQPSFGITNRTFYIDTFVYAPEMIYISGGNLSQTNITWNFSASSEHNLSYWLYSTNMSGVWSNSSYYNTITGNNATTTFSFNLSNATINKSICFQIFVNDTQGMQNSSIINCVSIINTYPTVNSFTWNGTNRTITNVTVGFTIKDSDIEGVSYWLYGSNMSGAWVNSSWTSISGTDNTTSFSFNLSNATRGKYVCFQIFVNDSQYAQNSSTVSCITTANTAPSLPTNLSPINGQAFSNANVTFNFSSTDNDGDTVTYFLFINESSSPDVLHYEGTQGNFSTNFTDDVYYWTVLAGDGYSNSSSTSVKNFIITTSNPAITVETVLETSDYTYFNTSNVTLNYHVFDSDGVANCSLWTNTTGTWVLNQTNTSAITLSATSNFSIISNEGNYMWSVECFDNVDNSSFALNNNTFINDRTAPTILLNALPGTLTTSTTPVDQTAIWIVDDDNSELASGCTYTLNYTNGALLQGPASLNCSESMVDLIPLGAGSYTFRLCATDLAYNTNCTNTDFTISTSVTYTPGGGGGSQVLAVVDNRKTCNITLQPSDIIFESSDIVKNIKVYNNENDTVTPSYSISKDYYEVRTEQSFIQAGTYQEIALVRKFTANFSTTQVLTLKDDNCADMSYQVVFNGEDTELSFIGLLLRAERALIKTLFNVVDIYGINIRFIVIPIVLFAIILMIASMTQTATNNKIIITIFATIILSLILAYTLPVVQEYTYNDSLVKTVYENIINMIKEYMDLLQTVFLDLESVQIRIWVLTLVYTMVMGGVIVGADIMSMDGLKKYAYLFGIGVSVIVFSHLLHFLSTVF